MALGWLASYLQGRTQSVKLSSTFSREYKVEIGVPQGSALGPLLFVLYTSESTQIAVRHNVTIHLFADDTQLYIVFRVSPKEDAKLALCHIEECVSDIHHWMIHSRLKLNPAKTEFLIVVPKHLEPSLDKVVLTVRNVQVQPVDVVRDLGVMMDKHLNMQCHVNKVVQSCNYHLRNIGRIRPCLTKEAAASLVHSLVASRIDYGNALLFGLPSSVTNRLQKVLNTAARIVSRTKRFEPITPVLHNLHWLKVEERIVYKLMVITYKALYGTAPAYIRDLLSIYTPVRSLRSQNTMLLTVPRSKKRYGDRSFAVAAPTLWNKLPATLRSIDTLEGFSRGLKCLLFDSSFSD